MAGNGRNTFNRSKMTDKSDKSAYVIKIQIGEETIFNPMLIDVTSSGSAKNSQIIINGNGKIKSSGKYQQSSSHLEDSSSSGQSSPRSGITPPLQSRILMKNSGKTSLIRFGSETSESDTESDVSSATEYHRSGSGSGSGCKGKNNGPCLTAQFAMREILDLSINNNNDDDHADTLSNKISTASKTLKKSSKIGDRVVVSTISSASSSPTSWDDSYSMMSSFSSSSNYPSTDVQVQMANQNRRCSAVAEMMTLSRKSKEIIHEESGFHLNEIGDFNNNNNENNSSLQSVNSSQNSSEDCGGNFAGFRDIFSKKNARETRNQIMSDKGTIRGYRNRVRDGIATFLQSKNEKSYVDKEQGRVVVYLTSMGVVRETFHKCQKVKQILRTLLVKFDERDCYMNRSIQVEIRQRIPEIISGNNQSNIDLPQVFLEGQYLGNADAIEKLNETGELRDMLRPYKSLSVLSTCERCGGFRMLPCPICNGSKKSVHRNHFTSEFVALKCMHCDVSGLTRCDNCNSSDS